MKEILTVVMAFSIVIAMMLLQILLSNARAFWLGWLIPGALLGTALYLYLRVQVPVSLGGMLLFTVPFLWCLEEWYRNRKRRLVEAEREINKRKSKRFVIKTWMAVLLTLIMTFLGISLGRVLDWWFGEISWSYIPLTAVIFAIVTMGALLMDTVKKK